MREYNEKDFTEIINIGDDLDPEIVHVCDGCGANFFFNGKFDVDKAQHNHYTNCSTEEIDKENKRVSNGYYNLDSYLDDLEDMEEDYT